MNSLKHGNPGRGRSGSRYVLISPCRNEQQHMITALDSVLGQTILPAMWLIVDDGSTDQTPQILEDYARDHSIIQVIHRSDRGKRSVGPGVVEAFDLGYEMLVDEPHGFLCKLDLDLDLPPKYFECLLEKMAADPRLGTCSGKPYVRHQTGRLEAEPCGDEMSVGMTKFYRRECFKQIGGFVPQVMWDGIDCHRCRLLGWRAASFDEPELRFVHLRPMGSSQKGILTGRMRHGYGQYFMGTSAAYMAASCLYRMATRPYVFGGLAMAWGYGCNMLKRVPRYEDSEFRKFLRRYQWQCLIKGKTRATRQVELEGGATWNSGQAEGGDRSELDMTWPETTVDLFGVPFASVTEKQVVDHILSSESGGWVVTPNLDILKKMVHTREGRDVSTKASFHVADGAPLVWASRLKNQPLPQRIAGSTLMVNLSQAAAARGKTIFLLGGDPGTAEAAAQVLREKFSELNVAGVHCPPVGFENDPVRMQVIRQQIQQASPDIVFVGLGFPKQELLIDQLRVDLPEAWWLGVGISFSFLAGRIRRAPIWMQKAGLEWMHRMAQEPARLAKRYLVDDIPFGLKLLGSSFLQRIRMME